MVQDLPPAGGYGPIQYKRNVPSRGFKPAYYLLAMGVICGYGFYSVTKGNRELVEFSREKAWARIHLIPLLEAEADRDHVRRMIAADARERELMKDVKGWRFGSVYNSDRFVRPTVSPTPTSEAHNQRPGA